MNTFDLFSLIIGLFCVVIGLSYLFVTYFIAKNKKDKKMYKIVGWALFVFGVIYVIQQFL